MRTLSFTLTDGVTGSRRMSSVVGVRVGIVSFKRVLPVPQHTGLQNTGPKSHKIVE